jgi:hypothetical protein
MCATAATPSRQTTRRIGFVGGAVAATLGLMMAIDSPARATTATAGWNITLTSTTLSTGGGSPHTLSTAATTVQTAPTDTCDSTCTPATNSVTYPYTVPAGSTAPTATKLLNAATASGIGNQTVTPTFKLAVPANTYAGTYTSTWTLTLASGP